MKWDFVAGLAGLSELESTTALVTFSVTFRNCHNEEHPASLSGLSSVARVASSVVDMSLYSGGVIAGSVREAQMQELSTAHAVRM